MFLIEEKIGFGFAGVYPHKCGARCVNIAPVARNVSRHGATKPQRYQRLFIALGPALVLRITWCHYHFPEIKRSEISPYVGTEVGMIEMLILYEFLLNKGLP
jgi:hypothetical protein